jgi:hypothetical protein
MHSFKEYYDQRREGYRGGEGTKVKNEVKMKSINSMESKNSATQPSIPALGALDPSY